MKKKNRSVYIVLIIVLLIGVTIGYAALNATLNINGRSNVSKNTWDLYFDNVVVNSDSVGEVKTPTIENSTTVDFEVALNLPGDFYEFTVDVVNNGTIDAMIDSIEKLPELTIEQQKYFDYVIEYQSGKKVQNNQMVKAGEFVRLKVKVEYKKDVEALDLPSDTSTLNLKFTLNYVQSDNLAVPVKDNGVFKVKVNGSLDEIGTIVTIGTEQFYVIGSDSENVKLFAKYNLYLGNECTWNPLTCISYGDEATGMQNKEMLGMFSAGSGVIKGTTVFSSEEQKGINYSSYNGSIVEGYVNNYKNILESKYGIDIKEARLISKNELMSSEIGCDSSYCSKAPYWIRSSVYWLSNSSNEERIYFLNNINNGYCYSTAWYSDKHVGGVRPVLVMSKDDIVIDNTPIAIGDINEIGTVVTIGTEEFYTIGTEGNNVKLLSKYNLYVGNYCTSNDVSSCVAYGEEATGMQHFKMFGYSLQNSQVYGGSAFSSETEKGEKYNSYNGSIVEGYVNDYKMLLEQNLNLEVEEARLITYDELISLGCSDYDCNTAQSFLYLTTYWTQSPSSFHESSGEYIYGIYFDGRVMNVSYNSSFSWGVRPVIVISKDYF